jgi:hypothetical protein
MNDKNTYDWHIWKAQEGCTTLTAAAEQQQLLKLTGRWVCEDLCQPFQFVHRMHHSCSSLAVSWPVYGTHGKTPSLIIITSVADNWAHRPSKLIYTTDVLEQHSEQAAPSDGKAAKIV